MKLLNYFFKCEQSTVNFNEIDFNISCMPIILKFKQVYAHDVTLLPARQVHSGTMAINLILIKTTEGHIFDAEEGVLYMSC